MKPEMEFDESTKSLVCYAYAKGFDAGAQATFKRIKELIYEIGHGDEMAEKNQ